MYNIASHGNYESLEYSMLTTKMVDALTNLPKKNGELSKRDRNAIQDSEIFLEKVLMGLALVAQKQHAGIEASEKGLFVFGKAVSAAEMIKNIAGHKVYYVIFQEYYDWIKSINAGQTLAEDKINQLKQFFGVLSSLFEGELDEHDYHSGGRNVPLTPSI